jgi:Fe2+ or Zn2+ uptake regulation protein
MPEPDSETENERLLEEAIAMLKQSGHRVTQPRIAILKTLIHEKVPVKIEDIHHRVREHNCDLATVYRCIAAFEKIGIVRRCFFPDGSSLFEFIVGGDHHHHIICTACQKVETLDVCVVEGLERLVHNRGYRNVSHMLEFFGVCEECSRGRNDEER